MVKVRVIKIRLPQGDIVIKNSAGIPVWLSGSEVCSVCGLGCKADPPGTTIAELKDRGWMKNMPYPLRSMTCILSDKGDKYYMHNECHFHAQTLAMGYEGVEKEPDGESPGRCM